MSDTICPSCRRPLLANLPACRFCGAAVAIDLDDLVSDNVAVVLERPRKGALSQSVGAFLGGLLAGAASVLTPVLLYTLVQ
jgi:hypothetical protein